MHEFVGFKKLPRLYRDVVITEKIDGTNAQIFITPENELIAGSRNRYLTLASDNYGFAKWCEANKQELLQLGPGRHFGEWYGAGIQRNYGLKEKRFALFNTHGIAHKPDCVGIVPTIFEGPFSRIHRVLHDLAETGSVAVPGFMQPEGVVIFHKPSGLHFKVTLDNDGHKGVVTP